MRNVVQDGAHIGAPDSSDADGKDDRVFATALAVRAWINWRRPEMLSEGLTYEIVTAQRDGKLSLQTQRLNSIVARFFKTADEVASEEPRAPQWRIDRGLS
jgi:hypothetical protein